MTEISMSEQEVHLPSHYVGIGASAGGLEAIEQFFMNMPADSGMAFIVVQHLSPDYKSLMVELLSKKTTMQVQRAEESAQVEVNTVYLIPPKKNLTIFHNKLLLNDQDHSKGINLPIDVFFKSLAEDQGEKAVAIILSGTGSDGMRGVRAIKEAGGMVMVQTENSAKFDGMPRSAISTGLADYILAPEEMPAQLLSFALHPYLSKSERNQTLLSDEDGLTRIFSLLREKTKVDFTYYKPTTVIRRIERRMMVNQVQNLRAYVTYVENYPNELTLLYRELLIGVTSFFRDRETFEVLQDTWLPGLLKNNRELRFWIAGCSTGEEAYTLAILARECMAALDSSNDIKIFATDIDRDAIVRAGAGEYPESIAADLSPRYLAKYFYRRGDVFQISRTIREMVVFAQHNLIKDPPFTNIDLISCRNLMIYLQPVLQRKVLDLFNFSLNPGGLMLLGTSETTGDMFGYFEPLHHKHKIYRSLGKRRPLSEKPEIKTPHVFDVKPLTWQSKGRGPYQQQQDDLRLMDRLLNGLGGDYLPLLLVVNDGMELIHSMGDTEGLFKLPSGKMQNDVTKMAVSELTIPLATGIPKALKSQEEIVFTNVRVMRGSEPVQLNVRIRPLPGKKNQEPLAVILVEEAASAVAQINASAGQAYDLDQEARHRISDLEQELQFNRENLQATIEELETTNEELQATNEELLASNEELQSTNEELQSVNEELFTVNAEYQTKIMELTELNNDMDNLLAGTRIGTLFLDENFNIRKFTPDIKAVFKIVESDIGRPLADLSHLLVDSDPLAVIRQTAELSEENTLEVRTQEGNWYLMRVLPYQVTQDIVSGVVVTFVPIDSLKEAQRRLYREKDLVGAIVNMLPTPAVLVDARERIIVMNPQACEQLAPQNLSGSAPGSLTLMPEELSHPIRQAFSQNQVQPIVSADATCAMESGAYPLQDDTGATAMVLAIGFKNQN